MENVLAVNFDEDSKAYEAMTTLKELDDQGRIELIGAAVVVRDEDGQVVTKDSVGDTGLQGTATGGMIGLLIGILGGPLGVLIGGAEGLLIGSLVDVSDAEETDSVLTAISRSVHADHTALLAQVDEQSPEVIDAAMARLGGTIERKPLDELKAEIAAAEDAQRSAAKAARKHLREQRHAQMTEKTNAKIQELKAKLPHANPVSA